MLKQYEGIIQLISYKWLLECTLIQWRLSIYPCMQTGTVNYSKELGLHSVTNRGIVPI